nr:MAG TPA: hypothetical protein [Caudoviricetes sp.]
MLIFITAILKKSFASILCILIFFCFCITLGSFIF